MRSPWRVLTTKRFAPVAIVVAMVALGAAVLVANVRASDVESSAVRTHDGDETTDKDTTTVTAPPQAGPAPAPESTEPPASGPAAPPPPDNTEPPDEPGGDAGVAAQVDFPLGGADGDPSIAVGCDQDADGRIGGSTGATVELLQPARICFPALAGDQPVDVQVTAPDGRATSLMASVTTDGRPPISFPYVDFTRTVDDLAGDYLVLAVQGVQQAPVAISVVEPDHPRVAVAERQGDSVDIVAAGFPPSTTIGLHVYRQQDPNSPTFGLLESFGPPTDARGRARVHVALPPAAGSGPRYGVLTVPGSLAAHDGGDAYGRLIFF